ncbi:MAG TPA: hypothetical protein VK611_00805, partial [Acidimicrobiales bacterium]|nr:hypothetical protein [Acidimicrobiales bacterium]
GGPPPPYTTAPTPPPPQPPTGPAHAPPPAGPPPPPRRNNTPVILGVLGAAAAALLLIVIITSSGSDDDDSGGEQTGGRPTVPNLDIPGDEGELSEDPAGSGPTTTNSQGCCDGGVGAEALAQELLAAVRNGDEATATATLCSDSHSGPDISDAIAGQASVDVDPATADTGGGNAYSASLLGTVDGEPITSGYVSVYPKTGEEGWCVYMFYAL